jgi:hypothetical protein
VAGAGAAGGRSDRQAKRARLMMSVVIAAATVLVVAALALVAEPETPAGTEPAAAPEGSAAGDEAAPAAPSADSDAASDAVDASARETPESAAATPSTGDADVDIPPIALDAYQRAAVGRCDEVGWATLAGIGKVESNHGRHGGAVPSADGGVAPLILGPQLDGSGAGGNTTPMPIGPWSGRWGLGSEWQQALGPMQFLPSTFERYAPSPDADPHNLYDAAQAAAAFLCDGEGEGVEAAILRYNRSSSYVEEVGRWAAIYGAGQA